MSDQLQRKSAVDPAQSSIVQAPAGSGKTTLLVERYLALLNRVEAPEEILAMTFTRKAAAEMRMRILRFFDPDYQPKSHESTAAERAAEVAEKVQNWRLREHPDRLMIRTIDSFSHWLVRAMPVASRLGPIPQPVDDARALYRRAARRVIEGLDDHELQADLEKVLDWLDHRSQEFEDLLASLLAKREQWLRAFKLSGRPKRVDFEAVLAQLVQQRLKQIHHQLQARLATMPGAANELADLLSSAAARLGDPYQRNDEAIFDPGIGLPGNDLNHLPQWRALAEALLIKTGQWRKSVNKNQGFPSEARADKERFCAILATLSEDTALATALHAARRLPEPGYGEGPHWSVLEALIRVLNQAAAELEVLFADRGQCDFTALSRAALTGLGEHDSDATDLALYLDQRINHILVDEFQDTNWAQLQLLERLTRGWQDGDGRTLFLVGDPMQSIYRFREAEVGLFIRSRDHGIGCDGPPLRLQPLRLNCNFRARAELVEFCNSAIGPSFPQVEDIAAGAIAYARSDAGRDAGGLVQVLATFDPEQEAEKIAALLAKSLQENASQPDWKAAVIVRSRSHLKDLLPALARHQIRYRSVKLDPLENRAVVQDLLALARVIRHPLDRAACLAVLRAPWCGLSLEDLHALAGDGRSPWHESSLGRLSEPARDRADRVIATILLARERAGRRSFRDRLEGAWRRLGGPALLSEGYGEIGDAHRLFELFELAETEGTLDDWNDLLERLAGTYTSSEACAEDIRVELLTMHAAKGLEWDLVILPGLNRQPQGDRKELLYWLPFTSDHGAEQVLLAPLRAAWEANNTPLIDLIRDERKQREAYEQQRLLYVAATRAREQLVLSASLAHGQNETKPASGSLLELLWPALKEIFSKQLEQSLPSEEQIQPAQTMLDQTLSRVIDGWRPTFKPGVDWRPPLPSREYRPEIEFNWAGCQARRNGTVLHWLLEEVGRTGIEDLTAEQRQVLLARIPSLLRMLGTGKETSETVAREIRQTLEQTLSSNTGRWILSNRHHTAACELPISGVIDGELVNAIIDRTFIDDTGTRWIIDYKSGYHEGGDLTAFLHNEAERYRDQLHRYRRLFEQIGAQTIRTALYLPRHDALQEV